MGYYVGAGESGIRTPGYVLSEMETVQQSIESFARDVAASNASAEFKAQWAAFTAEWQRFYADNAKGPLAWIARGTTPVYSKTLEYRDRLKQWQDSFKKAGGTVTRPDDPAGAPKGSSLWPWLLGGAIAAGAVWWVFGRREGDDGA
jgi:hypothetical protein